MKKNLFLVGCGKLGSSLLDYWQNMDDINNIYIIDPYCADNCKLMYNSGKTIFVNNLDELDVTPDVIIFSVKPQLFSQVVGDYKKFSENKNIIISSVMAGISSKVLKDYFPSNPILRVMPNIGAKFGASATAGFKDESLSEANVEFANNLYSKIGKFIWLEDEELINVATAIAGSGPAYFFNLAEEMVKAGMENGLSKDLSSILVSQTLMGSALLLEENNDAEELREKVTSKKGTTEAALSILMPENAKNVPIAIKKAVLRAVELEKS